jgi:D-beta-D-heptose 7-phosphate kinase/D-beta-D-heptose 1-phosphate adenosyltransferase
MSSNVVENIKKFTNKIVHITNKENIQKIRLIDSKTGQHILRVDTGEERLSPASQKDFPKDLDIDLLIISDYNKGFLTPELCEYLCKVYKNKPVFVDSKKRDLSCFRKCVLKINEKEREDMIKPPVKSKLIVTLGSSGAKYNNKRYKTNQVKVFDVTGAGDTFLSIISLFSASGLSIEESIKLANHAASISVTKSGTYSLSEKDIEKMQNIG